MGKPLRVLLVADAEAHWQPLLEEFQHNDYDPACERVANPAGLRAALARASWDVVLTHYDLHTFSASAALAILKEAQLDIPFLLVADTTETREMRAALSLGAQDFIRYQNLARLVPAVEREMNAAKVRAARALTEGALREAEVNYRKLVEQIPVGVHVMKLDKDSSTLSITPQLERMLGYAAAEWIADPHLWLNLIHPDDQERVRSELPHVYAPGAKPLIAEYRMLARDGRVVWIRDEIMLVRDQASQPQYVQSVKLDITDRMQAEADAQAIELRMAGWVKELEQSHREISLLNELSTQLQSCLTVEEACPSIADFVQLLFPAEAGALYLAAGGDRVALAVAWGRLPPEEAEFETEACVALRRGRLHSAELPQAGPQCQHVGEATALSYLCVPLIAQGETLGVLHLRLRRNSGALPDPDIPRESMTEAKQRLANTVAERLALALANLKLQAQLRARVETADAHSNGHAPEPELTQIEVGPLVLNLKTFELSVGDRLVKPTPVEFELLQFLMRHAGKVFTTEQLLQEVWRYPPGTGSQEVVRAHVRNLRAKLEPNPRQPIYLRTIGRFGYTITAEEPAPA